jgi:hypothetical protein
VTSAVLNALRGRSRSSRGAATDFSHGRKPVEIVSLGIQPRQGRKIRRESYAPPELEIQGRRKTPRLRVGLQSIAATRLGRMPSAAFENLFRTDHAKRAVIDRVQY